MICEYFHLFNDLCRDGKLWTLDHAFNWGGDCTIIAMGEEELAYLFSMQLMLGDVNLKEFQAVHDGFWPVRKGHDLSSYLGSYPIFCTDPSFLDYMMSPTGDLQWQKKMKERKHWSQADKQVYFI